MWQYDTGEDVVEAMVSKSRGNEMNEVLKWWEKVQYVCVGKMVGKSGVGVEVRVGHPFFSKERSVLSVLFRSL